MKISLEEAISLLPPKKSAYAFNDDGYYLFFMSHIREDLTNNREVLYLESNNRITYINSNGMYVITDKNKLSKFIRNKKINNILNEV